MVLRDLSSVITQQCSNKLHLHTPEAYLENIRTNCIVERPSVELVENTDCFSVTIERIHIGRIRIHQTESFTDYTARKTKDSGNHACIILPSIQGSSSLASENAHYEINPRMGVIISDCNEGLELKMTANSVHILVLIPINLMESTCTHLIGLNAKSPITFFPAIKGHFSPWIQILSTAVYGANISQHYESIRTSLEHLTVSGLLLTYPNNYSDAFEKSRSVAPPRTVRRAINFMEEHMKEPITIAEVAAHAGVGMRALQLAFRKYMGLSPGDWLLDRRLDRVHAMLMEEETTVTQAALAWGFGDLSDFSARYQKRYGYLPSKTPHRR